MSRRCFIAPLVLLVACDTPDDELGPVDVPCGIRDCAVGPDDGDLPDWNDADGVGKADALGVEAAIATGTLDGVFDADDVRAAFDAAGNRVGRRELGLIDAAVHSTAFDVTDEARALALATAARANLFDPEIDALDDARSAGGSDIPDAVRQLVENARLAGAVAYDVRERNNDGEGVWTPYPATTPPVENTAFDYTEITPTALADDIADVDVVYNAIVGSHTDQFCNTGGCVDFETATYEERRGGTGNVAAHYDEVFHEDIFARGRSGQKWANNCAILSDGSLHCLPAARRSVLQDVILTNPALSRCNQQPGFEDACRHLLYHGHIDIREGVVTGVEVSGRLTRRVARGDAKLVDPLAVLEAWGFEIAPSVTIRWGNTSDGVPVRDRDRGVLTSPTP